MDRFEWIGAAFAASIVAAATADYPLALLVAAVPFWSHVYRFCYRNFDRAALALIALLTLIFAAALLVSLGSAHKSGTDWYIAVVFGIAFLVVGIFLTPSRNAGQSKSRRQPPE